MTTVVSPGAGGRIDLGLRGSAVLITGAGSGIGAAAAWLLVAGASVVLVGRRGDMLRQTAGAIEEPGGQALCVPADLADADSPARIIAARWSRSDGLSPVSSFMTGAVIPLDGGQVIPHA